jgi:manganese/zinc/iron transport system substrate-binding protein
VVCTTGMIADLAREIGGDDIHVIQLVRAGVDPHLYSPTRDDVQQLAAADLILYNGLLLEGRMGDALQRLATGGKKVVAVAETLPPDTLLSDPEQGGQPDPHVWIDVQLWRQVAATVADHLIELAPEQAATFSQRRDDLLDRLETLDQSIRELAAGVPDPQRVLVTAHDAFGYFGRAYGIEVRGIQGFSTESEAGLRDINEMIDFLIEREIKAVFVESTVSDRNVKALIEGARSRGHEIEIGGELYSDSTGPEDTPEGTYIGMLEHNARTITQALGAAAELD